MKNDYDKLMLKLTLITLNGIKSTSVFPDISESESSESLLTRERESRMVTIIEMKKIKNELK